MLLVMVLELDGMSYVHLSVEDVLGWFLTTSAAVALFGYVGDVIR